VIRRSLATLVILGLVACAGDSIAADHTGATRSGAAESGPSNTAPASPSRTPLEGTWAIEEVTAAEALMAIREHGFGRAELRVLLDVSEATESFGLVLEFSGQDYTMYGSPDGGELVPWDYGSTFRVEDDILTLIWTVGGTTTFRWAIAEDRLELELLDDTSPDSFGLPNEVWAAALWTAEPWVSAGT
jgi:hypothetical protein